jgi:DNA-binding SARP family transcriptional activator/tetratricopeptide (TPR) repeat protein
VAVEFRILGPLQVLAGGSAVELGGARRRALLALLLLRRGEAVPAERLVEDLYGGSPPPTATKSLQAHVSRLRKALPDGCLATEGGGYALRPGADAVDADRFARLLERGRSELQAGEPRTAEASLEEGLALWRGPPLAELRYEEFAQAEVARLEELRLACLEELFEARLALGRHGELVGELERLVAEHPLRERLRAQLMRALYGSGRQADALAAYREARRTLLDELGLEPGRDLQELERAILAQDPALDAPRRARLADADGTAGRRAAGALVGRRRELAELEAALADARAGHGRLALVSGEAGIGKSRLVDELAAEARRAGARALWGRCWEAGGAPAYWPWVQALRAYVREVDDALLREQAGAGAASLAHLLPELRERLPDIPSPPPPDTDGARFHLFDSTAAFLRRAAAARPLLVVLDDVHAADAPSLRLLEFVAAELADAPALFVACYRDPELAPGDPTASLLAGLARCASVRLSLRGLAATEVASYVELAATEPPGNGLVAAIAAETEGNPLFVGEIVRLLAAEGRLGEDVGASWRLRVPETVKEVIGRRLARLSPPCREALSLASVLGREFSLTVLEALGGLTRGALLPLLDEATAARVLDEPPGAPGRMRFAHALVGDTLYDALPPGRRLELHRRAGEAIEAVAGPDPGALSELAHHFFRALPAVEPERVVEYARRAGDHAQSVVAHEEAARLYESALQALALSSAPECALERTLLLALGEALSRAGDTPRAKDAFRRAAELARRDDDATGLAAAALGYGGKIVWARPAGDALVVSLLEEALAAVGDGATPVRARLLARLAGALRDDGDPRRRLEVGELAVATARRTGDTTALIDALLGLSVAQYALDDHRRRLDVIAELRELAVAADDRETRYGAINAEVVLLSALNDFEAVRARTQALGVLAEELRQPSQRWFAAAMKAMLALHEGRYGDAENLVAGAYALGREVQPLEASAAHAIQLALLRREQGRAEEAYEPLAGAAAGSPARPFFRCALASVCAELGRADEARRLVEELAADAFAVLPRDNEWPLSGAFLAEACRELGDLGVATALYRELGPLAERSSANPPEGTVGAMARVLGTLAGMLGLAREAAEHLERAVEVDTAGGSPPWAAYAQAELADLLERSQPAEAELLRERARATAARLGMARLLARTAGATP